MQSLQWLDEMLRNQLELLGNTLNWCRVEGLSWGPSSSFAVEEQDRGGSAQGHGSLRGRVQDWVQMARQMDRVGSASNGDWVELKPWGQSRGHCIYWAVTCQVGGRHCHKSVRCPPLSRVYRKVWSKVCLISSWAWVSNNCFSMPVCS